MSLFDITEYNISFIRNRSGLILWLRMSLVTEGVRVIASYSIGLFC